MDDTLDPHESRLRSLLKAVTYRVIGTFATFTITFAVTGEFVTAMAIGSVEPLVKMIVYYLHERAWQLIPHGAVRRMAHRLGVKLRGEGSDRPPPA